jgi:hypothetical protein
MESADSSFKVVSLPNGSLGWALKLDCLSQQLQSCSHVHITKCNQVWHRTVTGTQFGRCNPTKNTYQYSPNEIFLLILCISIYSGLIFIPSDTNLLVQSYRMIDISLHTIGIFHLSSLSLSSSVRTDCATTCSTAYLLTYTESVFRSS